MNWRTIIFLVLFSILISAVWHWGILKVLAATNVDSVFKYAWNEGPGWFDF